MDALPQISAEQLKSFLLGHVDEFAEKMVAQVNAAAPGRLIADSEEGVRKLIHEFGRSAYEALLQQRIDAAEASFPPSGGSRPGRGDGTSGAQAPAE
jgi:hypothetical protein